MKKRFTILLVLLLTLVCVAASAQEYYTLPEIREQAATGWHETYTDKYGRETTVDIDVEVFGEDVAPILKVGFPLFERHDIHENAPYESDSSIERVGGKRTYVERMIGERIDLDRAYGMDYGNDLIVQDVYDYLNILLAPLELSVENFAFKQPEGFDVISNVKKTTGEVLSPAFYLINLCPKLREMPIYTHASFSVKAQGRPIYTPTLSFQMRNTEEYGLTVKTIVEQEEVVGDIPLCSLETVIENLEKKVKDGYIQGVSALRFGYALYNDPKNPKGTRSAYDAKCYYAVPSWVITCVYSPDPKETLWDEEKLAKRIEEENYHISYVQRYMVINAQTGEMLDYFGKKSQSDYQGFIPWDKVQ